MLKHLVLLAALALPGASAASYTVRSGDTLFQIAVQNRTTVEALMAENGLTSTTIRVGQVLRLPEGSGEAAVKNYGYVAGVKVQAPSRLREGDAFTLRLRGAAALQATVRFPSELNEDVRRPNEALRPFRVAGDEGYVLGRVVLGAQAPVRFEVEVNGQVLRGQIPVRENGLPVQVLGVSQDVVDTLADPRRQEEERRMEQAYALRGEPRWTQPFILPGTGPTTSAFGQKRRNRSQDPIRYHYGTDQRGAVGAPTRATNDGTVVVAGKFPVRGGLVVIDHGGGLVSAYFHLSKILVKEGQTVKRGQKIAEIGSTGFSTGPHLHWEMRLRGEAVDPLGWVNKLRP
ncbi:murein DD-endopeptidase MepM/ murein hydrolase activator NlpD [Deinobacterium chartae]|uniref:Murein DD-endopeptidase MepM/ murein hydrolase activator NlpD n=1 Tax=Deinobacterium chartae TaxID=521158 RepID=A0A841I1J4_9DEIO|nr:M23 family metallopeptidase [Deinobacterium chartae]MBB6097942.1 murein DD-endopeptidase MepM/ murein hydrolase activator NlpD [Deinobacterium chartae]